MAKSKPTSSDKVQTSSETQIQLIKYENNDKVAEAIQRIGELQRKRNELKTQTDEQIAKLQTELSEKLAPIDAEIELITKSLHAYCEPRKKVFFEKSKSLELPTGILAYRISPPSVKGNITKKKIEDILERNSLTKPVASFEKRLAKVFLRMKLEINKEAILQDPKKAKLVTGLTVQEGIENFYVKPYETNIEVGL
ncbi:MAG: host-nuclease inhibitor Gam family protein [Leptospiraceae bacterium]|nr:host-nuclease inhibitor Gam family protein [Leptospiraceae bacterium]